MSPEQILLLWLLMAAVMMLVYEYVNRGGRGA